jgi:hypothetical protein
MTAQPPNGAEPKQRRIPEGAQTARSASRAVRAPSGISRLLGFRAVWNPAPFGIQRRCCPAPLSGCAVMSLAFPERGLWIYTRRSTRRDER